jgi:hypothetical protein
MCVEDGTELVLNGGAATEEGVRVSSVGLCPADCPPGATFEGWIILSAPLNMTHGAGETAMVVFADDTAGQGGESGGGGGGMLMMAAAAAGGALLLLLLLVGICVFRRRRRRQGGGGGGSMPFKPGGNTPFMPGGSAAQTGPALRPYQPNFVPGKRKGSVLGGGRKGSAVGGQYDISGACRGQYDQFTGAQGETQSPAPGQGWGPPPPQSRGVYKGIGNAAGVQTRPYTATSRACLTGDEGHEGGYMAGVAGRVRRLSGAAMGGRPAIRSGSPKKLEDERASRSSRYAAGADAGSPEACGLRTYSERANGNGAPHHNGSDKPWEKGPFRPGFANPGASRPGQAPALGSGGTPTLAGLSGTSRYNVAPAGGFDDEEDDSARSDDMAQLHPDLLPAAQAAPSASPAPRGAPSGMPAAAGPSRRDRTGSLTSAVNSIGAAARQRKNSIKASFAPVGRKMSCGYGAGLRGFTAPQSTKSPEGKKTARERWLESQYGGTSGSRPLDSTPEEARLAAQRSCRQLSQSRSQESVGAGIGEPSAGCAQASEASPAPSARQGESASQLHCVRL